MQRSVPWRVIIGSNMHGCVPYHARFCSLSCRLLFTHVMIPPRACYHPFLNMVAPDPTSHGTNVSMSSSVPLHVVIDSSMTGSVPWHGEWSSHKFWKVHIGSRKEHDQTTNTFLDTDTIFRSMFLFLESVFLFLDPSFQSGPSMTLFSALVNFETVILDYVDSVVMQCCVTSWRIRRWISPLRQIFGDSIDLKDRSDNFSH